MNPHRVLCFGEALIDEFPDRRIVAGAPLHVAAHLAVLGWETSIVTRVGDDDDGRSIASTLQRVGVDGTHVEIDPTLPTGTTTITLAAEGHGFTVNRPAAWDAIEGPSVVPQTDVVYFGTLAMRDERSRGALDRILEHSLGRRVLDLNLRAPDYDAATVETALARADILKLSDGELTEASKLLGTRLDLKTLFSFGPEWICITSGAAGAELLGCDGSVWTSSATEAVVVDTVGAGDAFCAGLVAGLVGEGDPELALARGAAAAAATLGRRGGLPLE